MVKVSEHLQAARALIEQPGTWCTGTQFNEYGQRCALGAIYLYRSGYSTGAEYAAAVVSVAVVLQARIENGRMPKLTHFGGNVPAQSNDNWTNSSRLVSSGGLITAFNNSTDQQSVLELFDEAIAIEQAKEREEAYSAQVKDLMEHALTNVQEEEPELCPTP